LFCNAFDGGQNSVDLLRMAIELRNNIGSFRNTIRQMADGFTGFINQGLTGFTALS
jgi:hypothetical protein